MPIQGVLRGDHILLRARTPQGWLFIGGQKAHTAAFEWQPIDVTHKRLDDPTRALLDGQGHASESVDAEIIFSSETAFRFVKNSALVKSVERFQVARTNGSEDPQDWQVNEFTAQVSTFQEIAARETALMANITFLSSGEFAEIAKFCPFLVLDGNGQPEPLLTSDGTPFLVRCDP